MSERKSIRILYYIAAVVFVLCVPFFLLTSNIRWVANDLQLYQDSFNKYNVSQDTGFTDEELTDISKGLIDFLNSGVVNDAMDIFDEEEIAHMYDVRDIIQLCYIIQWSTLGYIAIFMAIGFIWKRKRFFQLLDTTVAFGSTLSIFSIASIGIAALVNFTWLFIAFHHVFFSGDSWVLSGYMPHIYTEGFFSDAALIIAVATILEALFIGIIAGYFILRRRRAIH